MDEKKEEGEKKEEDEKKETEEYEEEKDMPVDVTGAIDVTDIEVVDADFALESITDAQTEKEPPLRLKTRNDVYYKLYKELRQRAKEAKREAFANYLEAKRIKNTYLLEDVSESDEDDLVSAESE